MKWQKIMYGNNLASIMHRKGMGTFRSKIEEKEEDTPKKPNNSRFSDYKDNMEIVVEKPNIDMSGLLE